MNIFSKFLNKKDKNNNSVNDLINKLHKENQVEKLEEELLKLRTSNLSADEEKSWYICYGIAAFQRKDRETAFQRFKEAAQKYPDDPEIQFSLGQEFEYKGEIENMIDCFKKAPFPSVSSRHALTEARYAYLWDKIEDAISFIEPIFKAYFELKIADDNFLYIRGLPFLSETWEHYVAFCCLKKDFTAPLERINYCMQNLQDYNFSWLELNLKAIINNDFSKVIEEEKRIIEENKDKNLPYGFFGLRNMIFESKMLKDYSAAKILLDNIDFKLDFPWLEDVITLAKAQIAYKFNDEQKEKELLNIFFQNQPLLLEPNYALYFHLLDYQEKLKNIYRQKKT